MAIFVVPCSFFNSLYHCKDERNFLDKLESEGIAIELEIYPSQIAMLLQARSRALPYYPNFKIIQKRGK